MVKKEIEVEDGIWIREEDEKGNLVSETFLVKLKKIKKDEEHGSKLEEYEELAKEGEPLPSKYYEWKQSGEEKTFKFVLQRHYPTGKKEPIEPGKEYEEMHKVSDLVREGLIEDYLECDEKVKNFLEKNFKGLEHLMDCLLVKIRDHLDLRFSINEHSEGVTIHPPVPGGESAWAYFKEHMEEPDYKTSITPKMEHSKEWLTREGELRFPTRHREQPKQEAHYVEIARIDIIDSGEVKYGVQREDLHEYFFYGKVLKGRWIIRKLKMGREFEHWTWQLMRPKDQKPLDPQYHRDQGYYKIDMIKAPTTEQREMIDEETRRAREEESGKD